VATWVLASYSAHEGGVYRPRTASIKSLLVVAICEMQSRVAATNRDLWSRSYRRFMMSLHALEEDINQIMKW